MNNVLMSRKGRHFDFIEDPVFFYLQMTTHCKVRGTIKKYSTEVTFKPVKPHQFAYESNETTQIPIYTLVLDSSLKSPI